MTTRHEGIRDQVASRLAERAAALLEGTTEDLAVWARRIAEDALEAAALGRLDLVTALEEQAVALAEAQRLRLVGSAWDEVGLLVGDVLAGIAGLALEVAT